MATLWPYCTDVCSENQRNSYESLITCPIGKNEWCKVPVFASAISSGNDEAMKHQIFFSMKIFSFSTFVKIPEGVVVGIQIFAWAPNLYK